MTALRFEVEGETEPLALEPTLNFLMHPDERKRQAAAEALAKVFKENMPSVHAHHQYARQRQGNLRPLARLQGCGRQPPPGQPRRARGGGRAGRQRCVPPIRAPSHRYYAHEGQVARQAETRLLGPQRAAARQGRSASCPGRTRKQWCSRPMAASRPTWRHRQAVLRRRLDRRPGARGQGARRLLPSDRALGAPLHPDELSGQAARRDDAGARAGPWRAPGAGGAAGPAAGADAADAGRDRLGVRRDADLPGAARPPPTTHGEEGPAGPEGRGHDQHGRAPDRLLFASSAGCTRSAGRAN